MHPVAKSVDDLTRFCQTGVEFDIDPAFARSIDELSLCWSSNGDYGVRALARVMPHMRSLQHLKLNLSTIFKQGARELDRALSDMPWLHTLNLRIQFIGDLPAFARVLLRLKGLQGLRLTTGSFDFFNQRDFVKAVMRMKQLMILDLSCSRIGVCRLQSLAPILRSLPSLAVLNLGMNDFGKHHIRYLTGSMKKQKPNRLLPNGLRRRLDHVKEQRRLRKEATSSLAYLGPRVLKKLVLHGNDFGPDGAAALAPVLEQKSALQVLDLGATRIHTEGLRALAPAIAKMEQLKILNLNGNFICSDGLLVLAGALAQNRSLVELDLQNNIIRTEGVQELGESLSNIPAFKTLMLSGNRIRDTGIAAIAATLREIKSLQDLTLAENDIGDAGAATLADALRGVKTLKLLDLRGNAIGAHGASELSKILTELPVLEALDIGLNNIGNVGAKKLASALVQLQSLQTVGIGDHSITKDGELALWRHMQEIPFVKRIRNNRQLVNVNNSPPKMGTLHR